MLSFTQSLVAVLGFSSALVSAVPASVDATVHALGRRQSDELVGTIPASCNSTCASTLTIYSYCTGNEPLKCLQICTSDSLNNFYTCINCAVLNGNVSATDYSTIMETATTLATTCKSAGQTGTATVSLVPLSAATSNVTFNATSTSASASASASDSSTARPAGAAGARIGRVELGAVAAGVMAVVALAL